jgi:hypothetical protein
MSFDWKCKTLKKIGRISLKFINNYRKDTRDRKVRSQDLIWERKNPVLIK